MAMACAAAQAPPKPPEIVCDVTTVLLAGRMDGQVLRTEGVTVPGSPAARLTFRGHDAQNGRAALLIDDEPAENPVGMTVDQGAIVYLQEQPGIGKLLVATQAKPTADGWPATATLNGTLTLRVMTGRCRARPAR